MVGFVHFSNFFIPSEEYYNLQSCWITLYHDPWGKMPLCSQRGAKMPFFLLPHIDGIEWSKFQIPWPVNSYHTQWNDTLAHLCYFVLFVVLWEITLLLLCPYEKGHMSSWQGGVGLPRPAYFPCTPLNTSHTLKNTFLNLSQEIFEAHLLKPYIICCKHFHYLL